MNNYFLTFWFLIFYSLFAFASSDKKVNDEINTAIAIPSSRIISQPVAHEGHRENLRPSTSSTTNRVTATPLLSSDSLISQSTTATHTDPSPTLNTPQAIVVNPLSSSTPSVSSSIVATPIVPSLSILNLHQDTLIPPPISSTSQDTVVADDQKDGLLQQNVWITHHTEASEAIESADKSLDSIRQFSKLTLNTMPHLEPYHLYLRDNEGATYRLIRDVNARTTRFVRLYGSDDEISPDFVTISSPSSDTPKETLVNPAPQPYKGSRKFPSLNSTSYPTGVKTYYVDINGKRIRLDRGHGVPHADTQIHGGVISTQDPENYVPQNIKYNSPIRRDLEDDLRRQRLSYKEISIYHDNFIYDVVARVQGQDQRFRIPIPEGFLFFVYAENGEIQDTYYFPNFVDYEQLKGSGRDYKSFRELYRIQNLSEWFLLPEVTLGMVDEQQQKVDLADELVRKILLFPSTFFSNLSEDQMPPKAKVALLTTLLEWNIETAATLEFSSIENQLRLVYFYLPSQGKFWQLDDRYDNEKKLSIKQFLDDEEVSDIARDLVNFIIIHFSFCSSQFQLQEIVNYFEEANRNASFRWGSPELFPIIMKINCKDQVYEFNLAMISHQDISKIKKLIGGVSSYNSSKAKYVLSIVDARARKISTTIKEKLHIMRLYNDYEDLYDSQMHSFWERALLNHAINRKDVDLIDRRRIVDYYGYRKMENQKAFWLQRFVDYIKKNPTFDNFYEIAYWCATGRAAFLQNLEEQEYNCRPSNMLALQIYKGLNHLFPNTYGELCNGHIEYLQEGFGYYESDRFGITRSSILPPVLLDPLISNETGQMLKLLSNIFYQKIINYSGVSNDNQTDELRLLESYLESASTSGSSGSTSSNSNSSSTSSSSSSSSSFPSSKRIVLPTHVDDLYTDSQIRTLLEHYLPEREHYTVIAPAAVVFEDAELFSNAITEIVGPELITGNVVAMPIHLHGNHWAGAVFWRQPEGGIQVVYNDPMGNSIEEEPNALIFIQAIQTIAAEDIAPHIVDLQLRQQHNEIDCGPFTVDNLVRIARHATQLNGLNRDQIIITAELQQPINGNAAAIRVRHNIAIGTNTTFADTPLYLAIRELNSTIPIWSVNYSPTIHLTSSLFFKN